MAGVEGEVGRYAVQGEMVLRVGDLVGLRALEVDVGDDAADEAEFCEAETAEEDAEWEQNCEGW